MAWLLAPEPPSQTSLAQVFQDRLMRGETLPVPGVPDPLFGLLAKEAGFPALYLSGAMVTASLALPDIGLLEGEEMARRAEAIVAATGLPLLVDMDTGYGGNMNAVRAAKRFLRAGVAAVQIEDQAMPKRCGHLEGKELIPGQEMASRIAALKDAAPSLLVVARTDAFAVEGLASAVGRARLYRRAGADVLFPEALPDREAFRAFREAVEGPLLANMTEFGKTELLSVEEFRHLGYQIVLFPVSVLRVAAFAARHFLQALREKGTQLEFLGAMLHREELYRLIAYQDYEERDQELARRVAAWVEPWGGTGEPHSATQDG